MRAHSLMHKTRLPLRYWSRAVLLQSAATYGVSSYTLSNHLGIEPQAAWSMLGKMRRQIHTSEPAPYFMRDAGPIQCDETYVGQLRGQTKGKWVFGIYQAGSVSAQIVDRRDTRTLLAIIRRQVEPGATIFTDGWKAYQRLSEMGYRHESVNHSIGQFGNKSGVSTHHIDNFWMHLKRALRGTHRSVASKNLGTYLSDIQMRFGNRFDPCRIAHSYLKSLPEITIV